MTFSTPRSLAPALMAAAPPLFERYLPAPLLAEGPRGLMWWQWLALPAFVAVALVLGAALGWATRRALGHLAAHTETTWDDALLDRIGGPLAVLWAIAAFTALRPWLDLDADAGASTVLDHVLRAGTYLVVFWAGFRSLDVGFDAASAA